MKKIIFFITLVIGFMAMASAQDAIKVHSRQDHVIASLQEKGFSIASKTASVVITNPRQTFDEGKYRKNELLIRLKIEKMGENLTIITGEYTFNSKQASKWKPIINDRVHRLSWNSLQEALKDIQHSPPVASK